MSIKLMRHVSAPAGDPFVIGLSVKVKTRTLTVFLTEEEAQHFSNRLQSYAKGGGDQVFETIVETEDGR